MGDISGIQQDISNIEDTSFVVDIKTINKKTGREHKRSDDMTNILEECKEELYEDEETYQKAIRETWEEHDTKMESL